MTWVQWLRCMTICSILIHVSKLPCRRNWAFAFATIREQQFPLSHYCRIGSLELWLLSFPELVSPLMLYSCLSFICWTDSAIIIMDTQLTIFELSALFSDMLHSHYAITCISGSEFCWGKCASHTETESQLWSFQCHCHRILAFLLYSIWLTDSCTICCMLHSYNCCLLPNNKMSCSHRSCCWGNFTCWTCTIFGRYWLDFKGLLQFTNLLKYSVLTVMTVWAMSSRLCWRQCRRMVHSVHGVHGTGSVVAVGYNAVMQNSILVVVILP
jgi:hypothetical protein